MRPNTIQQDDGFHRRVRGSAPEASLSSDRFLCTNEPMNAPSVSFVKSRNPLIPSMARAEKKIVRLAVASGKPVKPNLVAAPLMPERLLNLMFSLPSLIRSSSNFVSCGGSTTLGKDRPLSITRVPKKSDERAINIAPSIKAYSKGAKFSGFRCDTYEYVPTATKPANTNNENPAYMASMFWRFKPWPPCRASPPTRSKAAANFP